jgi:hypothetical protein
LGEDLNISSLRRVLRSEKRHAIVRIAFESVNLDTLERTFSTLYVTIVTCMAAALSENAAKFGLGLNVSSVISHSLFRVFKPMIPDSQPLLRFFTRATCASLGIIAAFRLEKSLLVWANCLLGAELLVSSLELILSRKPAPLLNEISPESTLSRIRTSCVWAIAGAGLVVQVLPGNEMPLWIRGVLIGPRMFEYGLQALTLSMKGNDNSQLFT